ncbi:MAG TPA: hypothetical protein P5089_00370 [Candidatus Portnoybacteria bacterium]|nr:hypothetical protein [Candidatus Portnoybacteria bacterium]
MTDDKILLNLLAYQKKLEELNIPSKQFPERALTPNKTEALAHCQAMIEQVPIFLKESQHDKAERWFGFIQACLWQNGVYSIYDLKIHNSQF